MAEKLTRTPQYSSIRLGRINTAGKWLAVTSVCGLTAAGGGYGMARAFTAPEPQPPAPAVAHNHMLSTKAPGDSTTVVLEGSGGLVAAELGLVGFLMAGGATIGARSERRRRQGPQHRTGLR